MARNHALEQAIVNDPQSIETYLVYADWLKQNNEPRGELIAIQIALEQAPDEISEALYRRREEILLQTYPSELFGPAAPFEPQMLRGFVHHVQVRQPIDHRKQLTALLETDHPATCLLRTMAVPPEHRVRVRKMIAATGRSITVLDELDAQVTCKVLGERVSFTTEVRSQEKSTDKKAVNERCSSLWRITIDTAAGRERWWYGEREASMHKLSSGMGWIPRFEGQAHVHLIGRMRTLDHKAILWLEESAIIEANASSAPLSIKPVETTLGLPFDAPTPLEVQLPRGPAILDRPYNALGTVLPEIGIYVPYQPLRTETGEQTLPIFPEPRGRCAIGPSYGGPNGALCATRIPPRGGCWLLLTRIPGGAINVVFLKQAPHMAAFDAHGIRLATLTRHVVGRTTERRPTDILQYQVTILSTDTGTVLARAVLSRPLHPDSVILWVSDAVFVYSEGNTYEVSSETGAVTTHTAPRPPGRAIGHSNHAAGRAVYHPIPGRAARMICAEPPGPETPGTTLVVWVDDNGAQGGVVVPDAGWADCGMFGRIHVFEDGQIVAVGTRVWWVEPATGAVTDLGPAGYYGELLLTTDEGGQRRLWSQGPGAWWMALPS